MRLKNNNINLAGISPALVLALFICDEVYKKHGKDLVITSVNDSAHSMTSLHYAGAAADLRTSYFIDDVDQIVQAEIRAKLNADFDVILEADHIHIEYQPRRKT